MRSFDLTKFADNKTTKVRLRNPFTGLNSNFDGKVDRMAEWTDARTEAPYLILLDTVLFRLESDAVIFKLKYGC